MSEPKDQTDAPGPTAATEGPGPAARSAEGQLAPTSLLSTAGLVAGVLGVTAIAFGVALYAIDPNAVVIATVNLGFAVTALVFYALTNRTAIRRIASGRSTPLVLLEGFLVAGVLLAAIAANYFASGSTREWDLTRDQLFTLQEQSVKVASSLSRPVKILGFFKSSEANRNTLQELVELYQRHTDRIELELHNADTVAPAVARQYKLSPTGPRIVVTAGEDRIAKVKSPTEQEITNALVKVAERPPRKVYILTGHGEPSFAEGQDSDISFQKAAQALGDAGYLVEALSLVDKENVPADATVALLAGADKALFPNEVQALSAFTRAGGRLALLLDPGADFGLDSLLRPLGVEVGDNLVVDPNPASRALGFGPDAPVVTKFEEHAITAPLKGSALLFYWVRSVAPIVGVGGVSVVTLVQTPDTSWGETKFQEGGDVAKDDADFPGPVPVAVAVSKNTIAAAKKINDEGRLVVVGDSSFASNRFFVMSGNADFFLNIISWLAGEEQEITIRPKQRGATRIPLTESQVYGIVFFSVNLLPLLIVGFGFSVWAVRRRT